MIGDVIVKHLALIGELSDEDKRALRGLRGEIRDVRRGEEILRPGDHPTHSVVVLSGFLQRYTLTPQGNRQIHSFYIATDTPCLETIHADVMDNTLGAMVPSSIGLVSHCELMRVMEERPKILTLCWRETLVQAAMVREWLMRNSQKLAHAQMAHLFCEMITRSRAAGLCSAYSCDFPITQDDLAAALGMTTVHANRTLAILRAGGLVDLRSGVLAVHKWKELVEIAEFDPAYLHLRSPPDAATAKPWSISPRAVGLQR